MKRYILLSVIILLFSPVFSQKKAVFISKDEAVFQKYQKYIHNYRSQSMEIVLEKTAVFFLNAPYVASTLENTKGEQLVVNLREFDCVTYIETVIALSQTAKSDNFSFDEFINQLRNIRYRDGKVGDYSSRLHYTSDWVFDNEKMEFLENISYQLKGKKETKDIHFMSSNRKLYRQLKSNDYALRKIRLVEREINNRNGFYYVPSSTIRSVSSRIPHMTMIGFTTNIDGLDTTHTGFTYWKNGKLTFIHASSTEKKVVIDRKKLADYCATRKNCTGVIVAKIK